MSKTTIQHTHTTDRIIAAIPNYNMGHSLAELLPQVEAQCYDAIYVLDDASTDDSVAIASKFDQVKVVGGVRNVGAGANRNRILHIPGLRADDIIHFIDADTRLLTNNIPNTVRHIMVDPSIVAMTGLVVNSDGLQYAWNWGRKFSFLSWIGDNLVSHILQPAARRCPAVARPLWAASAPLLGKRPYILPNTKPIATDIYWGCEANLFMRYGTFKQMDGFDENLRVHEIIDLAIKFNKAGLRFRFDPSIAVKHLAIQVRSGNRQAEERRAKRYLRRKHSI